jgi:CHAT domain-containing protein/tetratricopeptide (TPR) repeat protein
VAALRADAPLDSIRQVGVELYYEGSYAEARAYLDEAIRRSIARYDTASWAEALTWLGFVDRMEGDHDAAIRAGERSLELKRLEDLDREVWRSLNLLAVVAWDQGRLGDAIELFTSTVDEAGRAGQTRGAAVAAGNRGLVYEGLGEFDLAVEGFESMHQAGVALADTVLMANALTNLGMLSVRMGDVESALGYLHRAIPLQLAVNAYGAQNAVGQLGTAFALAGDLGRAYQHLDSAVTLARSFGMRGEEGENLRVLGELYREAGDWPRALSTFESSRSILEDAGWVIEAGAALRSEAEILAEQGQLDAAAERARQALELHRRAGALPESLRDLVSLAELESLSGRVEAAQRALAEASRVADEIAAPRERIAVALSRARIANAAGEEGGVVEALSAAPPIETWGPDARWEGHWLLSRALSRLGRTVEAIDAGRRAVESVERVRATLASGILRTSFADSRQRVYSDLALALLGAGRVSEAFETADAARAHAPTGHALAPSASQMPPGLQPVAERELLLRRIDVLIDSLNAGAEPDEGRRSRLAEARRDYEAFVVREAEEARAPRSFGLGAASEPEIQAALDRGEALLEYLVTPDTLVVFVVRSSETTVARTPIRAQNLASRVRLAREAIASPLGQTRLPPRILEGLFATLMQPVLATGALAGVERLLIVPHGVLSYLPFAALRDSISGEYLVQRFTLSQLPSASALPALRDRARLREATTTALAPFPGALPGSRAEVEAVTRYQRQSRSFMGDQASEAALRASLARPGVVHVATHGVMNARSPLFSRVELAGGDGATSEDDGRLEVHEILEMQAAANLVFLSGCETGLGSAGSTRFDPGEDFTTLAEAFLGAGVEYVIATLWKVDDSSSASLAGLFYQGLTRLGPAEALAAAQRAMLTRSGENQPFHWAGYVAAGVSSTQG